MARWGHFTLLERIGAGATGEVWRAWDSLLHRDVAVKFLTSGADPAGGATSRTAGDAVEGTPLLEEARALARVQHPNVATVYGIADMDGRPGLWMELLRGSTLADEIERRGALPCAEVARIGLQLAAALEALALAGLVHRDIKPANVVLEPGGRAVLTDFGLGWRSRAVPDAAPSASGTPYFMSPSLLDGGTPTPRSDLYALGVTLRWALTGQAPLRARTFEELRARAAEGPAAPLQDERPDAPRPLVEAIERAMRTETDDAPFRAAVMRALLDRALAETGSGPALPSAAATGASPPPSRSSVAVLPFRNRGGDASDEYFSDGLADELITLFSKLRGLHVTARTSSFQFKGKDEDLASIGRKLNVSAIVEGSVTKDGNRVRVSVGLVNAGSGERIWSGTYDRTLDDIFAVQDEIAGSVVRSLREAWMAPGWDADMSAMGLGRGSNPEAHRLYLEARHLGGLGSVESVSRAVALMLEAVRLEPRHALGWAWLCRAYGAMSGANMIDPSEGLARARAAARRAVELEPSLSEAYAALGQIQMRHDWDWKGAEASLHRALALSPSNAEALRSAGVLARYLRRFDVAIELQRRSVELDPLAPTGYMSLGHSYRGAGRLEEAEAAYARGVQLAPMRRILHSALALVYLERGFLEKAWDEARREQDEPVGWMVQAIVRSAMGRRDDADALLRQLVEAHAGTAAYQIAQVHAARGEIDEAFAWLERAFRQRDPGLAEVGADPLFRSLTRDPRWRPFLETMGVPPGSKSA